MRRCFLKYIRILLMMISFILVFTSVFSVAAEYKIDKNIDEMINSPRYSIPMSILVGFAFKSDDPYVATSIVDISAEKEDVDYFILRVVLEKYSSSGYSPIKTWRDVKVTVDEDGTAYFNRKYAVNSHGSYRIRVSGEGYKGSKCVVTFSDKTSKTLAC